MDTWGVLVWNMALMSPGKGKAKENHAHAAQLLDQHGLQVALLTEASVFHMKQANAEASAAGLPEPYVFSPVGTKGRDYFTDADGERRPMIRSRCSAAVMSPLGPRLLGEDDVRARVGSRIVNMPFTTSRPGTWVAATVETVVGPVTCVSLYGLIEEPTDASMHTALSEVSPVFTDPDYKELVLLGGDFNIGEGLSDPSARKRSSIVLKRIEEYGLRDCLAECSKGDGIIDEALRVDYLFASEALMSRLDRCIEVPQKEWGPLSDHAPIVVEFRAS